MLEIRELTQESIIYADIAVENGKRTIEALKKRREEIEAIGKGKTGKTKYEFDKHVLEPFDKELNRNIFGVIGKENELNSSKTSFAILDEMIKEELRNPKTYEEFSLSGVPSKKVHERRKGPARTIRG